MKRLVCAFLAGAMALSLAACGGAASTSTAASSAAASTSAAPASSAVADSDLAYIQSNGKMVVGYTVYEPMNYTDADGSWDTKETELAAKSIDCIWNGLTLTDDREENMACTKPYVKNAQVVVVKEGTDYTSTADLIGKTVVAEAGSAGETTITENADLSQADYIAKSVQTDCLMEVAAGTADAAILDLTLASAMGSDVPDAVNTAFDELKADGTMQALADKYGLTLAD